MVVSLGRQTLSEHHLNPGVDAEKLVGRLVSVRAFAKELDSMGKRVWNVHIAALAPERRVIPTGQLVVQDDEITNLFKFLPGQVIVSLCDGFADSVEREKLDQSRDAAHDEVDAG